jgi:hypothetical protein
LSGIHADPTFKEVLHKTLKHVFCLGTQGYWFRILPSGNDNELDLTLCLHVKWDLLLPIMIYSGLVSFRVTSVVNDAFLVLDQWEELSCSMQTKHNIRMQITNIRRKGRSRVHYICIGQSIWRNPAVQPKAFTCLPTHRVRAEQRQLMLDFSRAGTRILDERNASRFNTLVPSEPRPANWRINVQEITNRFEKEINYALALDLNRLPRLSRTNAAPIIIRKEQQADLHARHMCVHNAILWGWRNEYFTYSK